MPRPFHLPITIGIAGVDRRGIAALDHDGAPGLVRQPVSLARVVGALLVVAGIVLVRKR
jgi:uncharacterized membrane protein YdcZ (DUF606 family)